MEQRNLLLAIVLSVVILFGFNYLFPPAIPPQPVDSGVSGETTTPAPGTGSVPSIPGVVPGTAVPPAEAREEVIGVSPRVDLSNDQLRGSIALRGAILDDLVLSKFFETLAEDSPNITLLSPAGSPKPYFTRFGWAPTPGSDVAVPDAETLWQATGGPLTQDTPVTLSLGQRRRPHLRAGDFPRRRVHVHRDPARGEQRRHGGGSGALRPDLPHRHAGHPGLLHSA